MYDTLADVRQESDQRISDMELAQIKSNALIGQLFVSIYRIATAANFTRNSGGSARVKIDEFVTFVDDELRSNVLTPLFNAHRDGDIPTSVMDQITQYQMEISPENMSDDTNDDEGDDGAVVRALANLDAADGEMPF